MTFQIGGGQQRRGGLPIRWIIAGIMALVAIISFYSKTEVNPVTGEKQRIGMNVEQEKALGLQAAPEMAEKMGGVEKGTASAAHVEEVGQQIVAKSDAAKSPYVGNFNFYLLKDPQTVNAFALPGGQIFITRALYDKLENEAQLSGVLGHEVGHVIGRHSSEQMARGQLGQQLAVAVGIGASGEDGRGRYAAMAAMMANQMIQLSYGREDESQADMIGLKYMAEAGYNPEGMLGVMKILAQVSKGSRQPEWMSSHPMPESRIKAIEEYLKTTYPNGVPSNLSDGKALR